MTVLAPAYAIFYFGVTISKRVQKKKNSRKANFMLLKGLEVRNLAC